VIGKEGMVVLMCLSLEHGGQGHSGQEHLGQNLGQRHWELGFETRVLAIEQLHLKLVVTDPFCPYKSLDPFSELSDCIRINLLRNINIRKRYCDKKKESVSKRHFGKQGITTYKIRSLRFWGDEMTGCD
jgi:hypothetical protein